MSRLLLADALATIAPEVLPADASKQVPWVNAVCARFFAVGKWAGTTTRWRGSDTAVNFAVYNDQFGGRFFTLPRGLLCILAGAHGNSAGSLQARFTSDRIRGPWFEFSTNGWAVGDAVAGSGLQDAGDGFTCFRDLPDTSYLRVKTDQNETDGIKMQFRGLDENQQPIYSGTGAAVIEGVELDIGAASTTTTSQKFSAIPSLIKKPVTFGPIRLYAVSVADATETLIGIYDPGETAPCFRRYRMFGQSTATTVHAMAKRRHVPAVADADEIIPSNLGAIELGLQGRRYDLANDPATAARYWMEAFDLLNSELGESRGGAAPRLQFDRAFGLGSIPRI